MLRWAMLFLIAFAPPCVYIAAQTSGTNVKDSTTTGFSGDRRFAGLRITMQGGLIILRGTVGSCTDKREALKQAASLGGIKEVEDHIEVKTKGISDRTVTREISQDLNNHNLHGVQFRVSKGIVTLRGTVPNESDRERAVSLICGTAGVVGVDDQRVRVLAHAHGK